MTVKIFFDNPRDAEKVSENLREPINDDNLSITVDPEELSLALRQVELKPTSYSIAEISEPE